MINWRQIFTVYRKELTDTLRDRRTLVSMFVVPVLLIPGLTIGMGALSAKMTSSALKVTPTVAVIGGEDSPALREALGKNSRIQVVADSSDYVKRIGEKTLRAAIEIPPGFDDAVRTGAKPPTVVIYDYTGEFRSENAASEVDRFLNTYRYGILKGKLSEQKLPENFVRVFEVSRKNVAPPEKVGGAIIGGLIPYLLIMLCLTGALYPALDLTAGEKERGTMETILCSPVGRTELVLGKFFLVMTTSLMTVACTLASYALCAFVLLKALSGQMQAGKAAEITALFQSGLPGLAWVCVLILPLAVLFSALLLTLALCAKSFKEAQSYVQPLMIVSMLAATVGFLPGLELNTKLALVPLVNVVLVSKEMVSGNFPMGLIALIFGSTCVYAAIALRIAVSMFKRENVIFRV